MADQAGERSVRVVAYDPTWVASFATARQELAAILPGALSIEHIGSTSVPGLAAKPTVDILVVVDDLTSVLARIDALAANGFEYRPGAFPPERQHLFFRRKVGGERTHHVHVLHQSAPEPADYRLFRDLLRTDPDVAARYEAAKLDLATRYARDRTGYVEAKEVVVEELLELARPDETKSP